MRRYGWRRVPSPAMGVALVALALSLGGTSYAVTKIEPRSVGNKQLKRGAVGNRQIKRSAVSASRIRANAVTGSKVADNSLSGSDIDEASLGLVPAAQTATNAAHAATADVATRAESADRVVFSERTASAESADHAVVAAALERVVYHTQTGSVEAAPSDSETSTADATARCGTGELVVGGGVRVDEGLRAADTYPDGAGRWTASVVNDDPNASHGFTVFAACLAARNVG